MSTQMDKLNGLSKPINQVSNNNDYLHNGRLMLCSGIILFTAISIMFCFHSYARWISNYRRRTQPQSHLLSPSQGLDPSILKNLSTLVYSSKTQDPVLECAVCLSEFQDGEKGRILPKCNHTFHICCIDMWFQSHSNCPLCRAPVQSGAVTEICAETVVTVVEQGGLQPELRQSCSTSYSPASLPHLECQRKSLELVSILVEVPIATVDERLMGLGQLGLHGSNSDPVKS